MARPKKKVIREFTDKTTGEKFFRIIMDVRSNKIPGMRVQRQSDPFKTYADANKSWNTFYRVCLEELTKRENIGESFESLIDAHEIAFRTGKLLDPISKASFEERIAIVRDWGKKLLRRSAKEISPFDIQMVMKDMMDAGKSYSRAMAFKSAVNKCYNWAIGSGYLKGVMRSPGFGVTLRRTEKKKQAILTEAETKILLKAAKDQDSPWYPIWAMALLTGMRNGELFALQWTDVDLENKMLTVSKSYNHSIKGIKSTKSGNWRSVPINEDLMALLTDLKATSQDIYVLPRIQGWKSNQQAKHLRKLCEGIGITSVNFHTLRACFATSLMRAKVAPAQVMKICGWEDLETMQRYIRLAGVEIEGATEVLRLLPSEEQPANIINLSDFRK